MATLAPPAPSPLADSALFADIAPELLDELSVEVFPVPADDIVIHQGQLGQALYIVLSGRVAIVRDFVDGRSSLINIVTAGGHFGELCFFDPGPRTANAVAMEDLTLARLNRADLVAWTQRHPSISTALLSAFARYDRRTEERVVDWVNYDVRARLAKLILRLGRHTEPELGTASCVVRHGLSQAELAQLTGSCRELVSRILREFQAQGWIRFRPGIIEILQPDELAARSTQRP